MTEPAYTPDDTRPAMATCAACGSVGSRPLCAGAPRPCVPVITPVDEQQAAREWADEKAEWVGRIWANRFPGGRDW